ncbi:MAG: bifunctional 5,10-methylene-tetrahydrofolate dehydrogenase/5,10-methylene-tetrahydrofolate cyclohydrolase [Flavobacteriia bacterium]|nr:bifunctional 5,10-methylene-tetrahydrofolate dehydrogenase/5,10-methylene-tetrahydrofolate cyclohydrolase [Flavobacteriia bacterium]OJX35921.1 MAG: bifunctional 5,10-methylene-tetrahydrofolate dehydrogenase/5,10-methylene-tetrahydrofolate cyclohydrolase [Flavobacteriia bacterium 40-80]
MILLDGKATATKVKSDIAEKVKERQANGQKIPHLAAVIVGSDGGSLTYVANKIKACEECGFKSTLIQFEETISEQELLDKVQELNNDPEIDGYIVQLPLPKHIDEEKILMAVNPLKDVDGFHPENVGKMALGLPTFVSATPAGILELLKHYRIETEGKNCVIVGRSNIVGSPLSILLSKNTNPGNCTVTLAHSKTRNLKEVCLKADIIIAAIGRPNFITAEMVREGAVVIDVGTTRVTDATRERGWRLVGDVDFENVAPKSSYITPVPGGVGPMTIASLMINTLKSLELRNL